MQHRNKEINLRNAFQSLQENHTHSVLQDLFFSCQLRLTET